MLIAASLPGKYILGFSEFHWKGISNMQLGAWRDDMVEGKGENKIILSMEVKNQYNSYTYVMSVVFCSLTSFFYSFQL